MKPARLATFHVTLHGFHLRCKTTWQTLMRRSVSPGLGESILELSSDLVKQRSISAPRTLSIPYEIRPSTANAALLDTQPEAEGGNPFRNVWQSRQAVPKGYAEHAWQGATSACHARCCGLSAMGTLLRTTRHIQALLCLRPGGLKPMWGTQRARPKHGFDTTHSLHVVIGLGTTLLVRSS